MELGSTIVKLIQTPLEYLSKSTKPFLSLVCLFFLFFFHILTFQVNMKSAIVSNTTMTLEIASFYGTFTQTEFILVSRNSSITLLFCRLLTRFGEIIFICFHLAGAPHLLHLLLCEENCTLFSICACTCMFPFSHILSSDCGLLSGGKL